MIEVRKYLTVSGGCPFDDWFTNLADQRAQVRIDARIARVTVGNFGDVKAVGGGVSELRIDYGAGYRVYLARHGAAVVLLLVGGDKRTQARDIEEARRLWDEWKQRQKSAG